MPPPHLAVLNPQTSDEGAPTRGRLAWLRASVVTSFQAPGQAAAGDAKRGGPVLKPVARSRLLRAPRLPDKAAPAAAPEGGAPAGVVGVPGDGAVSGPEQAVQGGPVMASVPAPLAAAQTSTQTLAQTPAPSLDALDASVNSRPAPPPAARLAPPMVPPLVLPPGARLAASPRSWTAAEAPIPPEARPASAPPAAAALPPAHELLVRAARVITDADADVQARDAAGAGSGPEEWQPPQARVPELLPMARPRLPLPDEDLLANLPPAQAPVRITVAPLPFSTPVPRPAIPADGARPPAAERAFRTGRQGARPAHAMSAVEIAAWREGAMEAGRARDPVIGVPRLWWWLALSAILVLPMAYAAGWLGLAGSGAEFLSTPLGQEAWILMGGPDAAFVYWALLLIAALVAQLLRPLEPVLILCAATWWGWTALHAAWMAGWLAQRIPPLPMPG